jgi:hypothetical protein
MKKKIRICKLLPTLCKTNRYTKESGNYRRLYRGGRILLFIIYSF